MNQQLIGTISVVTITAYAVIVTALATALLTPHRATRLRARLIALAAIGLVIAGALTLAAIY